LHFVGFAFGLDFGTDLAAGGGKLPTPLNVTPAGVSKIGAGAGAPWHDVPEQAGGASVGKPPSTRAS
jgi:hypothetical protein